MIYWIVNFIELWMRLKYLIKLYQNKSYFSAILKSVRILHNFWLVSDPMSQGGQVNNEISQCKLPLQLAGY